MPVRPYPALFTATSILPNRATVSATARPTADFQGNCRHPVAVLLHERLEGTDVSGRRRDTVSAR